MSGGWIMVHRQIMTHDVFRGDAMSRRDAWLWLLCNAAWKDTKHKIRGKMFDVPRGSLFVSLRSLTSEWGWKSDTKTRNFLEVLESEGMIVRKTTHGKTHITICNYSLYQNVEQPENAPETHPKRTRNALKKEIKQINKGNRPQFFQKITVGQAARELREELREKRYG